MTSNNTNDITLGLLLNPLYQTEIHRTRVNCKEMIDDKELKFYRKRISALSRDIMRGKITNKSLQDAHDDFVKAAIRYFKINDKSDILQKEYLEHEVSMEKLSANISHEDPFSIDDANDIIYKKKDNALPTLDDFVISKSMKENDDINPPQRRVINLKTDDLRIKGLRKKK